MRAQQDPPRASEQRLLALGSNRCQLLADIDKLLSGCFEFNGDLPLSNLPSRDFAIERGEFLARTQDFGFRGGQLLLKLRQG